MVRPRFRRAIVSPLPVAKRETVDSRRRVSLAKIVQRRDSHSSVSCMACTVSYVAHPVHPVHPAPLSIDPRLILVDFFGFSGIVLHVTRQGLEHLRSVVRAQVEREGLRPLSARTGIPVGQLRSILHGRAALSTTLELATSALGLEFYVGPPRVADTTRIASGSTPYTAGTVDRAPAPPAAEQSPTWATKLRQELRAGLREDLALLLRELTEPRRNAALPEAGDRRDPAYVAMRTPDPAAGGGPELERAPVVGYLAFQRSWLERHAIDPDRCTIMEVRGDAMQPTLPGGCSILVDHQRRRRRLGHIFVLRTGDEWIVRRAGKDQTGRWVLVSDNRRRPPEPWPHRGTAVAGEVRWMATTFS